MANNMTEKDILDGLDDLGYQGPVKNGGHAALANAIEGGVKSTEYTSLIAWLSSELKLLCNLEEQVHAVSSAEDEGAFLMELNSFLNELGCPYPSLTTEGSISQRLSASPSVRRELLNFLITELLAARITVGVVVRKKSEITAVSASSNTSSNSNKAQKPESRTAGNLKNACIALGLPKPPETITWQQLFSKLVDKTKDHLSKLPNNKAAASAGKPLFTGVLTENQWSALDRLNDSMRKEYGIRAGLLLQRLDVTVQSFTWSDRVKKKEDELFRTYKPLRQAMTTTVGRNGSGGEITIADLLSATDYLTLVEKTSSSNFRTGTRTKLNKLMIANRPPDRGGRPTEIEPPPPEMPPWQKRTPGGPPGGPGGHFAAGGPPHGQRQVGGRGSGRIQGAGWQGDRGGGGGYSGKGGDYHQNQYQQQQYQQQQYQQQGYGGYHQQQQPYHQQGHQQQYYQQQQQVDPNYGYQHQNQGYYHQSDGGGRGRGRGRGRW